jgi:hypothetical protein
MTQLPFSFNREAAQQNIDPEYIKICSGLSEDFFGKLEKEEIEKIYDPTILRGSPKVDSGCER